MRRTLTDKGVAALKPRLKRYTFPDPELGGMYIRVQPSGAKAYVAVAKAPGGRQVWTTIGPTDAIAIAFARIQAREILTRVRAGKSPIEAQADTVADVAANWMRRHVQAKGIRTAKEIEQMIAKHILPVWANREFVSIRRSEVVKLLDDVEDNSGARTADRVLTLVQSMANWYATRTDNYVPPIVRGMRRQSPEGSRPGPGFWTMPRSPRCGRSPKHPALSVRSYRPCY